MFTVSCAEGVLYRGAERSAGDALHSIFYGTRPLMRGTVLEAWLPYPRSRAAWGNYWATKAMAEALPGVRLRIEGI